MIAEKYLSRNLLYRRPSNGPLADLVERFAARLVQAGWFGSWVLRLTDVAQLRAPRCEPRSKDGRPSAFLPGPKGAKPWVNTDAEIRGLLAGMRVSEATDVKRLIRALITEIVADVDAVAGEVVLVIHSPSIASPPPGTHQSCASALNGPRATAQRADPRAISRRRRTPRPPPAAANSILVLGEIQDAGDTAELRMDTRGCRDNFGDDSQE